MDDIEIIKQLRKYMEEAEIKHPIWPKSVLKAAVNVSEESGELLKEVNNLCNMKEIVLNDSCPSGKHYGFNFNGSGSDKDCYNCTIGYACSRAMTYRHFQARIKTEAFHTLVTIIRFIRNIESYGDGF